MQDLVATLSDLLYHKTKEQRKSMQTATLNECFIREYRSVYFETTQMN